MKFALASLIAFSTFTPNLQAATSRCTLSDKLGLEKVKVEGKEAYTDKKKTVSITLACPDLSAKEIEELLAIFPERTKVDKNVSYQSLQPAGDSIARIYFDTSNGKLTQLAVVTKTKSSADTEALVLKVLKEVR